MADAPNPFLFWQLELEAIEAGFVPSIDFPGKVDFAGKQAATASGDVLGFWRVMSARTKPDFPIAIWREDGQSDIIVQFGRKAPQRMDPEGEPWHDFMSSTFLKCAAVRRRQWAAALETGKWEDGKISREQTTNEKLGLDDIPTTPASEGGNMPEGEAGDANDLNAQIRAKVESLLADFEKLPRVYDTLDVANQAAAIIEPLRGLGREGEAKRKAEKQPHLDAATAVDARWSFLRSASDAISRMLASVQAFKDAERRRLEAEERKRQDEERKRIAEETRVRLAAEAAELQRLAESMQMEPEPQPTAEDIAAEAEQLAAEQVAEQVASAPPIEAPRVGTAFGKGISKPKRKKGVITDKAAFIAALTGQADFDEWLEAKANRLAYAGTALAGMRIE